MSVFDHPRSVAVGILLGVAAVAVPVAVTWLQTRRALIRNGY